MEINTSPKAVINSIVSITRFNRGEASKIFDEVSTTGAKVVLKNNVPGCVLLSPEEYMRLVEVVEDAELLMEAEARLAKGPGNTYTEAEVMAACGITEEDLADVEEDIE